jgi:hypothetical protein
MRKGRGRGKGREGRMRRKRTVSTASSSDDERGVVFLANILRSLEKFKQKRRRCQMRNKTFTAGRSSVLGLLVALTLILGLSGPGWAITDQQAKSFGESKGLIEAKLAGYLWSHTQDEKNEGKPDYLKAALGEEEFKATIPHSTDPNKKAEFSTWGIKDTTSAYLRGEAAKIIQEFGASQQVSVLFTVAKEEQDYSAKEELFLAGYKLAIKTAVSPTQKEELIVDFLHDCHSASRRQQEFGGGIPLQSLEYLLAEAEDEGIAGVVGELENLRNLLREDETMVQRLTEAIKNIDLRSRYKGAAFYQAILKGEVPLEDWMLRGLFKVKTVQNQEYANKILLKLLRDKDGENLYFLKKTLEENGYLRSENLNPSFEYVPSPTPSPTPSPSPVALGVSNWQVSFSSGSRNQVKIAPPAVKPASYTKCLEVINVALTAQPTSPSQTTLVNDQLNLQQPLPKEIEFGLSYQMDYPKDGLVLIGADGLRILKNGVETLQGTCSISLTPIITVKNLTSGAISRLNGQAIENAPYQFNYWEILSGRFAAPANTVIQAVQIRVIISGNCHLYLDDAYVRRADTEFIHIAPQITQATASPGIIFSGELVRLRVEAATDEPVGTSVSGQWGSNLEGVLGSPVVRPTESDPSGQAKSKVSLFASATLLKEGGHNLFFTLRDSYGFEDRRVAQVKVLKPNIVLTLTSPSVTPDPSGTPTFFQGTLGFRATVAGADEVLADLTINTQLLVNGFPEGAVCSVYPATFSLDTRRLPNGLNNFQAKVILDGTTSGRRVHQTFYSEGLYLYLRNQKSVKAVITSVDPLSRRTPVGITFDAGSSWGDIVSYYWDLGKNDMFGRQQTSQLKRVGVTYENNGRSDQTYIVSLTVTGRDGAQDTAKVLVTVKPVALQMR